MTQQLDRYAAQHWITAGQHTAGTMFARDATLARYHFRRPPTVKADPNEAAAAVRFMAVCEELGPFRHPLIAVIVHNIGATTWAETEGHRRTNGMAIFKVALDQLVALYGSRNAA